MPDNSRILPLSSQAISQIQSSKQITTLQGVILSLVENSLDAGSTKVVITTNFQRGGCTVSDNGCGIPPFEFFENGGLARMYYTSKCNPDYFHQMHGSSGTFLAALANLSLLTITSRSVSTDNEASLTLHHGKILQRKSGASIEHMAPFSTPTGTCITVRDLFGNMPVRVKQRSLRSDAGRGDDKAWYDLLREVVALLLAWPHRCAVRICEEGGKERVSNLSTAQLSVSTALTERLLNVRSTRREQYTINDAIPMLWQAGLTTSDSRHNWIPVSARTSEVVIAGLISLDKASTKDCQFISFGVRPCSPLEGHNDIYDSVNKIFADSNFGALQDDSDVKVAEKEPRKRDRRYKSGGHIGKQVHGRKGIDRWPMFILRIHLRDNSSQHVDVQRMSDATFKAIDDVMKTTITQWLATNHFRPRKLRLRGNELQQSPTTATYSKECSLAAFDPLPPPESATAKVICASDEIQAQRLTHMKKRKVVDIYGRCGDFENEGRSVSGRPRDPFVSWSRIKSGRSSFYRDFWEGAKPGTAPVSGTRPGAIETKSRPSTAFDLPTLDTGSPSSINGGVIVNHKPTKQALIRGADDFPSQDCTSDSYGSFDEHEILEALKGLCPDEKDDREQRDPETSAMPSDRADRMIVWTDPVSKRAVQIDNRTGFALPSKSSSRRMHSIADASSTLQTQNPGAMERPASTSHLLSLARRPRSVQSNEQTWLSGFLKEWQNPVFVQQDEQKIPAASFAQPMTQSMPATTCHDHFFTGVDHSSTQKLSKIALDHARVIRQVDRKYILCALPASTMTEKDNGETLLLIDQHAASERVILEGLLSEICEVTAEGTTLSVTLRKSLRFDVTEVEFQQLQRHVQHFASWGVGYDLMLRDESATTSRVHHAQRHHIVVVNALPRGIAERCTLVPKLVIDLLRSEVWSLWKKDAPTQPCVTTSAALDRKDSAHPWLNRIGSCPKGLLDMLNSRACRSAVMFNDELSVADCEQLLKKLSRCAFPFICAHGRVSMVPIAGIESGLWNKEGQKDLVESWYGDSSFATAFRRWKAVERSENDAVYK